MKILVTGAQGMMGMGLCPILCENGHEVVATDLPELDVQHPDQVRHAIRQAQPALVIHLAAQTDVDGCENNPDMAFRVNTLGTQHVALACQQFGCALVYMSTISVFNGNKETAYTEFDTPEPRSVYSSSKYQGEVIVQRLVRYSYVVRTGWMFGGGVHDKKFVARILELARTRAQLKVVDDKFGSPTYTVDIARGLCRLIETNMYGVYHLVNTGEPVSRYSVAQRILEYAGLNTCELLQVSSDEFPLPAPRPRMEAGRNYQLELRGWNWMRPWKEALAEYVHILVK